MLKIVSEDEEPERYRLGGSRFEKTKWWKQLKATIDEGDWTPGSVASLSLTKTEFESIGLHEQSVKRVIQRYLVDQGKPFFIVRISHPIDRPIIKFTVRYPKDAPKTKKRN